MGQPPSPPLLRQEKELTIMWTTIQTSAHPDAGAWVEPADAVASWLTIYDGPIRTQRDARNAVDAIVRRDGGAARCFLGKRVGKFHYLARRGR